jgi:hypothetical protein
MSPDTGIRECAVALYRQTRKTTTGDGPAGNGGNVSDEVNGEDVSQEVTGEDVPDGVNGEDVPDERSGYYVAGHDWPAITNEIRIDDMYAALRRIGERQVVAAGASLLKAGQQPGQTSTS